MKGSLLIVADEPSTPELLERYFTGHGYRCDTADGVETAERKLMEHDYHAAVVDKNLTTNGRYGEGGLDIVRFIKQRSPATGIIVMTGFATIESVVEAMRMGAFDYIIKPFRMEEVREKIDRLIEFRSYLNPDGVMNMYRLLHDQLLDLYEQSDKTTEEKKRLFLQLIQEKLDFIFSTFKSLERMLLFQRESLAHVAFLTEEIIEQTPGSDPRRELLDKIIQQTDKRL